MLQTLTMVVFMTGVWQPTRGMLHGGGLHEHGSDGAADFLEGGERSIAFH